MNEINPQNEEKPKSKNWFVRNKVLTTILAIIVVIIFISFWSSNENVNSNKNINANIQKTLIVPNQTSNNNQEIVIAPNAQMSVVSNIPERTKDKVVNIDISVKPENATLLLAKRGGETIALMKLDTDVIKVPLTLTEGNNLFEFTVQDENGKSSKILSTAEITLDTVGPIIYKSCVTTTGKPSFVTSPSGEWVCVNTGDFTGPLNGTAYAPVIGGAGDNIGVIKFDRKTLTVKADGYINQKVAISVSEGTNIYEIYATDNLGNETTERYELSWTDKSVPTTTSNDTTSDTSGCCKICTTGKACGDSCISRSYTCHKGPGCACDAY